MSSIQQTPTTLYFGYTNATPDIASLDVKTVHPDTLLGCPAAFTVIGESHYVGLPALGFHELCSCRSLPSETTYETPLSPAVEREFRFDGDQIGATTLVAGRPIDSFPGPETATVAYRFGPDAWTTILVTDDGYETYHTYPEHELALYTETTVTRRNAPTESPVGDSNRHATDYRTTNQRTTNQHTTE